MTPSHRADMTPQSLPEIGIINVPNRLVAELSGLLASHQCYPDVQVGHNRMARGGTFVSAAVIGGQELAITLIEKHRKVVWSGGRRVMTWVDVPNTVVTSLGNDAVPAHTTFHLSEELAETVLAKVETTRKR